LNRVPRRQVVRLAGSDKNTGAAKTGNELVTSLQGAVEKFERSAGTIVQTPDQTRVAGYALRLARRRQAVRRRGLRDGRVSPEDDRFLVDRDLGASHWTWTPPRRQAIGSGASAA